MFAAPMAAFARFCVISLNIFSLFSSCHLMSVSISTRSKNILTPYSFLRLNERRASQATRTSSSLWKNLLHNSGDRSHSPTMRRRVSSLAHMFALFCVTHGKAAGRSRRLASPCRHRSIFDDIRADACRPASPIPRLSFAASASCLACLVQNRRSSRGILQRYASAVTAPE